MCQRHLAVQRHAGDEAAGHQLPVALEIGLRQLQVGQGRCPAGLRLLENNESKLAALRQALAEGEQSGIAEYGLESMLAELDAGN